MYSPYYGNLPPILLCKSIPTVSPFLMIFSMIIDHKKNANYSLME